MHHSLWSAPERWQAGPIKAGLCHRAPLRPGDLVLRDCGYLSLRVAQIESHGAWYLVALSKGVAVYLEAQAQAEAIDLFSYLQKNYADDDVIDLPVSLGHERVSCRLLPIACLNRSSRNVDAKRWRSTKKGRTRTSLPDTFPH